MSQAPGWYRDPFHREQERYWDGHMWTQGTRPVEAPGSDGSKSDGSKSYGSKEAEGTDVPTSTGASAADQAEERLAAAFASAASGSASAKDVPPTAAPSFAPLGAPVQPVAAFAGSGHRKGGGHRRRRGAAFGISAAAVVLIVAGLFAVIPMGGGRTGEASAAEAIDTAATQTINANSADVTMSMSANTVGGQESLSGSGAFDFTQKAGTMTITIPVNGQQYSEQEILDNSTIYVNVSGLDTGLAPSQPWVSMPAESDKSPTDISTLDATAFLHQLQSVGGWATSLGQTLYDGALVTEYQTTLPASALESSMGALSSSAGKALGLDLPDMTIDVYVTTDKLLKAVVLPSYSFDIAGETITVNETLSFSNFGTPVNVTPPPADQVEPLSQLFGSLGNSGSTGNTGNTGTSGSSGTSGTAA